MLCFVKGLDGLRIGCSDTIASPFAKPTNELVYALTYTWQSPSLATRYNPLHAGTDTVAI